MTTIRDLFSSKKYLMMLTGVIVLLGAKFGLQLDNELIAAILAVIAVTIGAQGVADQGKEAARIAAAATPKLESLAGKVLTTDLMSDPMPMTDEQLVGFIRRNRDSVRALVNEPGQG